MNNARDGEDWLPHDEEEPHTDGQSHANGETRAEEWPQPSPLGAELRPVLPFSEAMLPEVLRKPVVDVAERMQVPLEYPAACAMVCLAGAVNRRARIQPKVEDPDWLVVPNLWGGLVGLAGVLLKSPVLNVMAKPLYTMQRLWRESHQSKMEFFEKQKEAAELRLAAWKEQTKAALKAGKAPPARPNTALPVPTQRRIIINDATSEASHTIMAGNPAGLFLIRDELMGWLSLMERPGREGERALCLEAWNGDTSHTIDRVGRGQIYVPACCLSIIGGITPARLRSYLVEALKDGPANDGLMQRFQVLVYPDVPRHWRYVDRAPCSSRVNEMFDRLLSLDAEDPLIFRFNTEAQAFFVDWLTRLQNRLRSEELSPTMASHLGKYPKLMLAVALLSALADGCGNDNENLVDLYYAEHGTTWCTVLESHARRIYSCVLSPRMQAATDLAAKIKKRVIGAEGALERRDVYRHCWSGLDNPASVGDALDVLEDAGWVRHQWQKPGPQGGRPPDRWLVNPRIWKAD
jgi:putative DNA primase/helicase